MSLETVNATYVHNIKYILLEWEGFEHKVA